MCAILCPCQDLYKSWKNPSRKRQKTNRGKRRPVWWADNKNKWDPEDPEDDDGAKGSIVQRPLARQGRLKFRRSLGLGLGKLMQFLSHKLQEFKNLRADGVGAEGLDFIVMPCHARDTVY